MIAGRVNRNRRVTPTTPSMENSLKFGKPFFAPMATEKREEQPKDNQYTEKEEKFLDDAADQFADLFLTQIELEQEQKRKAKESKK